MLFWWTGPWSDAQLAAACIGGGLFVFFGLFILMLWVPGYEKTDTYAMERIQSGWGFIIVGLLFGVFGMFFFALMCAVLAGFLVWVAVRSLRIVAKRN